METVTTYAPLLVDAERNGIHESLLGHSLMECSIEDGNLWNCWKKFLHSHDALEVSGIVERTEDCTFLDDIDNLIGNQAGLGDLHAAMQHTVTHCLNLFSRL